MCLIYPIKLDTKNKDGVKYIITTCLDPWSTSMEFMDDLASIMRNAVLNAIGTVRITIFSNKLNFLFECLVFPDSNFCSLNNWGLDFARRWCRLAVYQYK